MPTRIKDRARSRSSQPASTHPTFGPAAAPVAAALNPLRLPKYGRSLCQTALASLREQGYAAWYATRREPVATLLLLALDQGWITAAALQVAFDGPAPHESLHRLCATAWTVLPDWIEALARRYALDPAQAPAGSPFVEIDWRMDGDRPCWVLQMHSWWFHEFDLDRVPPALACAIAQTLDLIGSRLTECCLLRDLAEMWEDESVAVFQSLRARGLTDLDALWCYVQEQTAYADEFGWGEADFAAWWDEMAAFCAPASAWLRRRLIRNDPRDDATHLKLLIKRLWRWRRRGIGQCPWFRWLRRAVLTLRRCERRWPELPGRALTLEPEDDSEPLAYSQPIGFGEPWESRVLDDFNDFANNVVGFSWRLRGDCSCWEGLRDTLECFAIGQGLLIGAGQANEITQR